jgi:hypothetical protein
MNDNLEAVKRRVKKLLALSKSPNENEAMAAMEKALSLMEEYRLTEAECVYAREAVPGTKRLSKWRAVLSNAVAWLYCCESLRNTGRGQIIFYGNAADAYMAGEMYLYLSKTVERMAKRNIRKPARLKYREKYKLGVASGLGFRIRQLGDSVSWSNTRGRRLAAVTKAMEKEFQVERSKIKITGSGSGAFRRGAAAADGISLNRQATGHGGLYIESK